MLEFIGIGDLHLDGPLRKYLPNLNRLVCDEVLRTIRYGQEKGVQRFFFYGDIAHRPELSTDALANLVRVFQVLSKKAKGCSFHVIHGNHDVLREGHNSIQLLKQMVDHSSAEIDVQLYIEDTAVELDDVGVKFLPWPGTKVEADKLNVGHIEVAGTKMDTGRASHTDLSLGKALCVMGHLHTAQRVKNVHYSGTLYQVTFGEQPEKFFHHGRVSDATKAKIELIGRRPSIRLHNVYVETEDDLEKIPNESGDLVKAYIQTGSKLSESALAKFGSVIEVKSVKSKKDLQALIQEDVVLTEEVLSFQQQDLLAAWMKDTNVNKEEQQLALVEFQRLISRRD